MPRTFTRLYSDRSLFYISKREVAFVFLALKKFF